MDFSDLKPLEIIPYGIELMKQGDYHNAILAFDERLKHTQNSLPALMYRAVCKLELLVVASHEDTERLYGEIELDLTKALSFIETLPHGDLS